MECTADSVLEEDRDKRDKLWHILLARLRELLIALEVEGCVSKLQVTEPLLNEFIATTEGGFISVWLHPEDGTGSWNQIAPSDKCEPWSLTPDGVAELSGKQMNIDELADAFASKLIPLSR